MKVSSVVSGVTLALVLTGCGINKEEQAAAPQAPETSNQAESVEALEAAQANFDQIPANALVRVPVDQQGNATGAPEFRTNNSATQLDSTEAMAAAFAAGNAPEAVVDGSGELDSDSSVQSWHGLGGGFGHPGGVGGGFGNGVGIGGGYGNGVGIGGGFDNGVGIGGGFGGGFGQPGGVGIGGGFGQGGFGQGGISGGYAHSSSFKSYNHQYFSRQFQPVLGWRGARFGYRPYLGGRRFVGGGYRYHCYRPFRRW